MSDLNIKFKILKVNPDEHSITVRYFTDYLTEDMLATSIDNIGKIIKDNKGSPLTCRTDYNINVWKTPSPTQEELISIIKSNMPVAWFKLKKDVLDPTVNTSLSTAQSLINTVQTLSINIAPPITPEIIPFISRRQLILGLLQLNLITNDEAIEAASNGAIPTFMQNVINSLPEPQKTEAMVTWASMTMCERNNPLLLQMAAINNISSDQLDKYFSDFSKL